MFLTKLRTARVLLLAAGGLTAGVGGYSSRVGAEEKPGLPQAEARHVPNWTPDVSRLPETAAKYYAAIKPRPEEQRWRRIPWLTDLSVAIRVAKEEHRPLLIWTSQQSHPLERC